MNRLYFIFSDELLLIIWTYKCHIEHQCNIYVFIYLFSLELREHTFALLLKLVNVQFWRWVGSGCNVMIVQSRAENDWQVKKKNRKEEDDRSANDEGM